MRKGLTREELRLIVKRHGGVDRFASLVPVEPRTVWYWLAGRKLHPVFAARVRQLGGEDKNQKVRCDGPEEP